jgi:hypothetical protein
MVQEESHVSALPGHRGCLPECSQQKAAPEHEEKVSTNKTNTENLLHNCTTKLKFDDYTSEDIHINNGIGQGDPLSMVLYQYYNTDVLDIPNNSNKSAMAYVDDAILITTGENFVETHKMLTDMMTREGGAINWSNDHNSRFEYSKLALMDFAHCNSRKKRHLLKLLNTTLAPAENTKYLGVYFNQHLDWNTQ